MYIPKSSLAGIRWPAIADTYDATLLALQFQLQQSEWWSAEKLRSKQLEQLGGLLTHANRTVPFYQEHYRAHNYRPKQFLSEDLWQSTPIVTRQQIQQAGDDLVSKQLPASHGATHDISTSGSTGRTVKVKGTQVTEAFWHALTLRDHLWHRRDLSAKLAVIRKFKDGSGTPPSGTMSKDWGVASAIFEGAGPAAILDINSNLEQQVEWLLQQQPDYLLTYPSLVAEIAGYFKATGKALPKLRGISTLGEIVTPEIRAMCREAWGVALTDIYSCQETGYLALQCPEHDHYHVQAEGVVLEVLDDDDMPCAPGETGRVIVTSLHNFATPLIRYDIGDFAEVGHACSCGRGLPVLNKIIGRVRNLLTYPDGQKRWPLVGSDDFSTLAPVLRFQLLQSTVQDIEVKLVVSRALDEAEEQALRDRICRALDYDFSLSFSYVDDIPRSVGGKYEDFISSVQ